MTEIIEFRTEQEWRTAYPVLSTLRTRLTESEFIARRETLLTAGYHLFGMLIDGRLVAVASADIYPHVTSGVNCWVHDLATAEAERSNGYGATLMRHVEKWAKRQGCKRLSVHTRLEREKAQKFYESKLDYRRAAVAYYKDL